MRRYAVFAALAAISLQAREYERRVNLKHTHPETRIFASLPSQEDSAIFRFSARNGDHLTVRLEPISRRLVAQAVLIYPSGRQDGPGATLDSDLDESGTYRVKVTPRQQTSGRFRVYLRLRRDSSRSPK